MATKRSKRNQNKEKTMPTFTDDTAFPNTDGLSKENKKVVNIIIEHFNNTIAIYREEIINLKDRVETLESSLENEVTDINTLVTRLDAFERRRENEHVDKMKSNLVISGAVQNSDLNENCVQTVLALVGSLSDVTLHENDIKTASRIGRKQQNGPDKRNIVFELSQQYKKREILNACRRCKPAFYINEYLIPSRASIMYVLRKAKKKFPNKIGNLRSNDGSIQVFPTEHGDSSGPRARPLTVNTASELDKYLLQQVNKTSKDIMEN